MSYDKYSEVSMLVIKCAVRDMLRLDELEPFQGALKKRSDKVIDELAASIENDGLLMPFVVWRTADGNNKLLDGHGRLLALRKLQVPDDYVLPVVYVDANNEDEAKQSLLQIVSSYGTISKHGALAFCSSIPEYRAPVIKKFVTPRTARRSAKSPGKSLIKIMVPTDKEQEVRRILSGVDYIEVL